MKYADSHTESVLDYMPALRRISYEFAEVLTVSSILSLFVISPEALESFGNHYLTSGGGVFAKFHPATWAAVAALALRCFKSKQPLRKMWLLFTGDSGAFLLMIAVLFAALHAVFISMTPVTPLVDTLVLPVLLFILLKDLNQNTRRILAICLSVLLCINALMAFVEIAQGHHFLSFDVPDNVSSDPSRTDATFDWRAQLALDWRAMALLGHPLVNGMLIGGWIVCLASPGAKWIPMPVRLALLILQLASMFTFGARAALIVTFALTGIVIIRAAIGVVVDGARLTPRMLLYTLVGAMLLVGVPAMAYQSGLLDRTLDRFEHDEGSASTRVAMFDMFKPMSAAEILLGPDKEVVETNQRLNGLEFGIESSWLGLCLKYGAVITFIILVGLYSFTKSVVRSCAPGAITVYVLWYTLVSVSTSMSGKTTSFAMICVLIILFLPKNPYFHSSPTKRRRFPRRLRFSR